jgi:hypothetical protein
MSTTTYRRHSLLLPPVPRQGKRCHIRPSSFEIPRRDVGLPYIIIIHSHQHHLTFNYPFHHTSTRPSPPRTRTYTPCFALSIMNKLARPTMAPSVRAFSSGPVIMRDVVASAPKLTRESISECLCMQEMADLALLYLF